jgi:hypothetical protein
MQTGMLSVQLKYSVFLTLKAGKWKYMWNECRKTVKMFERQKIVSRIIFFLEFTPQFENIFSSEVYYF